MAFFLALALVTPMCAASLTIGNVLPVGQMPEGAVICNVEEKLGDRGALARASGKYCTVVGHADNTTQLKICLLYTSDAADD